MDSAWRIRCAMGGAEGTDVRWFGSSLRKGAVKDPAIKSGLNQNQESKTMSHSLLP